MSAPPSRNERIVQLYLGGMTQADLARRFGITQQRVSQIITDAVPTGYDPRAHKNAAISRNHHARIAAKFHFPHLA